MSVSTQPPPSSGHGQETVTAAIESSLAELASLLVKLLTTPFAVLINSAGFQAQVAALRDRDPNKLNPSTVARPLSFYVLWMAAHFTLGGVYWRFVFNSDIEAGKVAEAVRTQWQAISEFVSKFSPVTGRLEALVIIAFAAIGVIAVKAFLVSAAGFILRCPVRFQTALQASAYAFATLIAFQYYIIAICFAPGLKPYGQVILIYGSLAISIVLVVRVNEVIRNIDGTGTIATFSSWFIGTAAWQFVVVYVAAAALKDQSGIQLYWTTFLSYFVAPIYTLVHAS